MLTFRKIDKNEAVLALDSEGASTLLSAFQRLETGETTSVEVSVEFDSAILGARRRSTGPSALVLSYREPGIADGELSPSGQSRVNWKLVEAEGEVRYAIQRLSDALHTGEFSPAEFLSVQVPKSRHLLQLFAEFS